MPKSICPVWRVFNSPITRPMSRIELAPVVAMAAFAAIVFGLGQGVTYIARGVMPLELFGTEGYGARLGKFNAISLTMMAIAPAAVAALRESFGGRAAFLVVAGVGFLGAMAALVLILLIRQSDAKNQNPALQDRLNP